MSNEQTPAATTPQQTQGETKVPMQQQNQGDRSSPSPQNGPEEKPLADKPAQQK